jgi:hypothetical protein
MFKAGRRGTQTAREFSGEGSSSELVEWLNANKEDLDRKRVRDLLRNIRIVVSDWIPESLDGTSWVRRGPQKDFDRARKDIQRLVCKYKFAPRLNGVPGAIICQWVPVSGLNGKYKKRWPPVDGKYDDVQAIYALVTLPPGCIPRILECDCGTWFYRRFSHQRFCSAPCRDKANKATPAAREYRRKKAHEYYWLHHNKQTK